MHIAAALGKPVVAPLWFNFARLYATIEPQVEIIVHGYRLSALLSEGMPLSAQEVPNRP